MAQGRTHRRQDGTLVAGSTALLMSAVVLLRPINRPIPRAPGPPADGDSLFCQAHDGYRVDEDDNGEYWCRADRQNPHQLEPAPPDER